MYSLSGGNQALNTLNRSSLGLVCHACIKLHRCACILMPEELLYLLEVCPALKGECCRRVPQIMRGNIREVVPLDKLAYMASDGCGVQRSVGVGLAAKDKCGWHERGLILALLFPLECHEQSVQAEGYRYNAILARLGAAYVHLVGALLVNGNIAAYGEGELFSVKVSPLQADSFTTAEPGCNEHIEQALPVKRLV